MTITFCTDVDMTNNLNHRKLDSKKYNFHSNIISKFFIDWVLFSCEIRSNQFQHFQSSPNLLQTRETHPNYSGFPPNHPNKSNYPIWTFQRIKNTYGNVTTLNQGPNQTFELFNT